MQNQSGTGKDPMAQLDQAMAETFQELERQGSGVAPADVVQPQPQPRPRRAERVRQQDEDDQQEETQDERPARQGRQGQGTRRRATREPSPASVILDEADQEEETTQDDGERSSRRRRREQDDTTPQRGPDGRFLPSRADTDADEDDDEDDDLDDVQAGGRRPVESEEVDVEEDDDVEPEGRRQAEDDEEPDDRRDRRGRRRWPREVRKEIERQVAAQVEAKVSKVIEERDQLRQQQAETQQFEAQAVDTLVKAIGTQEQRDQLQAIVNNPRAPLEQRNRAAATLNRYLANEKYVRTYRTALLAVDRNDKTQRRQQAIEHLAKYQISLDPQIVHAGDEANTMAHVARVAILAERARGEAEIARLKRQLATRGGQGDERAVRNGRIGRDSLASANGRRANGRVAVADPLRRAMGFDRGLGSDSRVPMPTDDVLRQLRDGEITLRDLGLDQ